MINALALKGLLLAIVAKMVSHDLHGAIVPTDSVTQTRFDAGAADAVMAAIAENGGALSPSTLYYVLDARTIRDGKLAIVFGFREASLYADPKGFNDAGKACGVGQIHVDEMRGVLPIEWTCKALRGDRVLGFRAMIRLIHYYEGKCGVLGSALGAYVGNGTCATGYAIVTRRCKEAGVDCSKVLE